MDFSKSVEEKIGNNNVQKEVDLMDSDDIDHIFSQSASAAIGSSFMHVNYVPEQGRFMQNDQEFTHISKLPENHNNILKDELNKQEQNSHLNRIQDHYSEQQQSNIINLLDSSEEPVNNPNVDLISFENYGENLINQNASSQKSQIDSIQSNYINNEISNLLEYVPEKDASMQMTQLQDEQAQTTALSAKMLLESSLSASSMQQNSVNNQSEVQKKSSSQQQQIQLQKQGSSSSKNLVTNIHQNIIIEDVNDDEEQERQSETQSQLLSKEVDTIINISDQQMMDRVILVCEPELITEGYITTYKLYRVKSKIKHQTEFDSEVLRRFSDFEWLYTELVNKYGGYLIPLLPEKNILTKFNIETQDFTKDRQKNLEFFLQKLLEHPKLHTVPELKIFLFAKNEIFSIVKGEAESQKTIEQKYHNVLGSVKNYFQASIVPLFGYNNQEKGQEIVREQTELDKDLNNYEAFIQNLAQKMFSFLKVYQSHFNDMEEELKYLNQLNYHFQQYSETIMPENNPNRIKGSGSSSNHHSQISSSNSSKNSQQQVLISQSILYLKEDYIFQWKNQFQPQLEIWYKNCIAAQEALNRRKEIIISIVKDTKRVQELNLLNKKNNNQRDTEMDILYNNLVKNQQRLDSINKILVNEIKEYDETQQQQFMGMINSFMEIEKDFHYKQNEIYHGRVPNII